MSARGIPEQELLENQDPSVAYMLIEQTGERVPLEIPVEAVVAASKQRRRKKAESKPAEEVVPEPTDEELDELLAQFEAGAPVEVATPTEGVTVVEESAEE